MSSIIGALAYISDPLPDVFRSKFSVTTVSNSYLFGTLVYTVVKKIYSAR